MSIVLRIPAALCGAAILGACATTPQLPPAPAELQPPAGEALVFKAFATGVQVYECAADPAQPASYQWRFKGPEAALTDREGRNIGKHYAGPTWEAQDGSKVVAEVKAQAKAGDTAVPLLLLRAKTNSGKGALASVKSIQRLDTAGGRAPAEACSSDNVAKVARVQYTATYYFYN